jgi:DNA modification methylase
VPVVTANSEDPLVLEEIELAENLDRKDLSWKEVADTHARLHTLRQAQALDRAQKASPGVAIPAGIAQTMHTVADTAREVRGSAAGDNHANTRMEILIAPHLHRPEIAAAPDLKTAFKTLRKLEDVERNRALAVAVGETFHSGLHQIHHGDCLTLLAKPEFAGKFDIICTDPPYGMGADEFGDGGGKLEGIEHNYKDDYDSWRDLMASFAAASWFVTKPEAHLYAWCDFDRFHELKGMLQAVGWYVFRTPITNYKKNSGRVPLPDKGPRRTTEWCLYAIKGGKLVNAIVPDLMITEADEQLGHGAQKPIAVYENLLARSVKPGDWVLDPFAGTGTLLPAAHGMKCVAVCIEQNQASYGICLERAQMLDRQKELLP